MGERGPYNERRGKWPPDPPMSGCVEGLADGAWRPISLHHYTNGVSLWGISSEKDRDRRHPHFTAWRFTGPSFPIAEEQDGALLIWKWWDAPGELRSYSDNGGDEDWVALFPAGWHGEGDAPSWMEEGGPFGCCAVHFYRIYDGRTLAVGCHA